MRALILAAGRGTRLGLAHDAPKCLATVGDRVLLDRYLDALGALGLPVTIVVGHRADLIRAHVDAREAPPTLLDNARYTEGSVVSLATGLDVVDGDVLLLDGDVAFDPTLLARLVHAEGPDALLVDVGTVFTDEQYMAGIDGARVRALRRGPADGYETQGEWVGFAKLSAASVRRLRHAILTQIAQGETAGGYEDALARMLADTMVVAVPTDGAPWVEIDFPDDLAKARAMFGG
ncbi:MAG: phosphocholine cytidylyltransferase family protein [Gemmatimonadota bacterium]|nr:phosphocholine cytidylyltransferase family protein [Gemmatimonadota bacterium]